MPREFQRVLRVGEQVRRELAVLLRDEVKDPRIGMVTISDVEVSRDFARARVYFTIYGDQGIVSACQQGLDSAAGFLRGELGRRMKIRTVPQLRFIYDDTQQQGDKIAELIERGLAGNCTHDE